MPLRGRWDCRYRCGIRAVRMPWRWTSSWLDEGDIKMLEARAQEREFLTRELMVEVGSGTGARTKGRGAMMILRDGRGKDGGAEAGAGAETVAEMEQRNIGGGVVRGTRVTDLEVGRERGVRIGGTRQTRDKTKDGIIRTNVEAGVVARKGGIGDEKVTMMDADKARETRAMIGGGTSIGSVA